MLIDNLKYDYTGNRLTKVTEEQIGASNGYPYLAAPNTITYDDNGNMSSHKDKQLASIEYNILNLPDKMVTSGIKLAKTYRNIYRADGVKVSKSISVTSEIRGTDYLDGFQYSFNGGSIITVNPIVLQFVPTSEGYYDFTSNSYIYNYTDHLGNVRLSYTDTNKDGIIQPRSYRVQQCDGVFNPPFELPICTDYWKPGEIVEVNNYYPFGLLHNYTGTTQNAYQYKYNGKELQETGMYDYGARFYMPDLGRWGVSDGKGELYLSKSPYSYANNTPVNAIDPDGNLVIFINGQHGGSGESPDYWRSSKPTRYMTANGGSPFAIYARFDQAIMRQLNDNNSLYRDGAMGGFKNTLSSDDFVPSNRFSYNRIEAGFTQGKKDAKDIIL